MTRKDYEKIAKVFADYHAFAGAFAGSPWREACSAELIGRISAMLKVDNPRFDVERFRKACGLED